MSAKPLSAGELDRLSGVVNDPKVNHFGCGCGGAGLAEKHFPALIDTARENVLLLAQRKRAAKALMCSPETIGSDAEKIQIGFDASRRILNDEAMRQTDKIVSQREQIAALTAQYDNLLAHITESTDDPPDGCQCPACVVLDERDQLRQELDEAHASEFRAHRREEKLEADLEDAKRALRDNLMEDLRRHG